MTNFAVTVILLSLIMVIRYGIVSWSLIKVCQVMKLSPIEVVPLRRDVIKKDILYSILSSVIFAISGAVLIYQYEAGKTLIYLDPYQYGGIWILMSFLFYLFVQDTFYYWLHRFLHRRNLYRYHVIHHSSRRPSAWTSFAFHPVEAIFQAAVIPVLVLFIPIHWIVLCLVLLVMAMFGVTNHLGYEIYPESLEKRFYLITASHHQKHHQYPTRNYGLFFTFWDKIMGTEKGELT